MQLLTGNPVLPLLLLAGQQPLELPDGDERADDQQEGGWHDRPAEEGARGEGEIHTEVRRHSGKVALLRRNPVKNHNKGGAGTPERQSGKNWKFAISPQPGWCSKSYYVTVSHPAHPSIFRLKEQLQNQNNKSCQKSEIGGEGIKNLEAQLAEKMKAIKVKKEQMKKKGAYG